MSISFVNLMCSLLMLGNPLQDKPAIRQVSPLGITHPVVAFGADTFMISAEGKEVWNYPLGTRDGWLLPDGNFQLTITKCSQYPGGGVLIVNREGKILFEYKGTQSEVDTSQPLPGGHIMLTESGPKPRILELDKTGKIVTEFPLQCQTKDFHMQTRMARKLRNGHYLVPHLIDMAVKEYDRDGKVVWEVPTPNWPFQVRRLDSGNTLITCTRGNMVIEVDKAGKTVWQVSNDDLPGAPIKDACGAQRLENGNTVITSYGAGGADDIKLLEITPDKKIVWTLYTGRTHGIHAFQILDAESHPFKGKWIR